MPYWVAIAAGIAATGAAFTGIAQNKATERAGSKAESLAEEQAEEDIRRFEINTGITQSGLRLKRDEVESADFFRRAQVRQAKKQFAFEQEQNRYQRAQNQYQTIMGVINADKQLTNSLIAKLSRRPQGVGYAL